MTVLVYCSGQMTYRSRALSCDLSVILPIHNERENLAPLFAEIHQALSGEDYEIIAVDDGSDDGSLAELELHCGRLPIRILSFTSRCGQSAALLAGFDLARGTIGISLDADGQNNPADIPRLLHIVRSGQAEAAVGVRMHRQDSSWKRFQSRLANRVRDLVTSDRVRDTGCSLRVVPVKAFVLLPRFNGMHRFVPTLLKRQGLRIQEIEVSHRPRQFGRTKYGAANRAWRGLWDVIGVRWLMRRRLPTAAVRRIDG